MSFKLPVIGNDRMPPEQTAEPMKHSSYIGAGSPTRCFLPSCRKPFDGSCYRGDDDRYYCSKECAKVGEEGEFETVVNIRAG